MIFANVGQRRWRSVPSNANQWGETSGGRTTPPEPFGSGHPPTAVTVTPAASTNARLREFQRHSGLLVEVPDCFRAAHSLDPYVLGSGLVRVQVLCGDDHQGRERLVHPVTLPVEVGLHDDRVVIGHRGFQRFRYGPGALDTRRGD